MALREVDKQLPLSVAFGVCTFRRAALTQTLQSLANQTVWKRASCVVIVADNDQTPSASVLVEAARRSTSLPIEYVHAPAQNISVARNALLDKARELGVDFLTMIDDDEIAMPVWAENLLQEIIATNADAVLGPAIAVYGPDAPNWMREVRLHDVTPVFGRDGRIVTGYTSNLILRLSSPFLRDRRFDLGCGISGGEDDVFLSGMVQDGGSIGFAPNAIVSEDVAADRMHLWPLLRRYFRAGQTHGRISLIHRKSKKLTVFVTAATKATVLLTWAGLTAFSPARRTKALMRASLQLGVCSHLLGWRALDIYGS